ncbi:1,2-phenylacetyl-CoA epoxidase subunit PaaE [Novosphingobium pentaromativorans]|uniref:Phenylacetate-CoA oxygenase/reductase, PaaK subunit n=1 Tax=Novosphingobium pentaromativorans US6-1 TaxID=1088721 RepID=G6EHH8_9SPHN|nr:1,2-phenylacetyl-CoA epoxidase subunit PaaE [Novosphingobium pentaromativorans]AIT81871.1 phenylacetate-CoA oxygenase [Novosphingobium pentaromativorans US6-1]EHJ59467.1 phenylacetate-CoA oxygenase/reductase, PaaK subunit [Novosphingobium pentaromativorans US6-1]
MSVQFHPLEVIEVRREIADAVSLRLRVPDDLAEAFRYTPGQHLTLRTEIAGDDIRRNYSICSAPHEGELRVAIKRVPQGAFSTWANGEIKEGQAIDVMPPHGSFTWSFDPTREGSYAAFAVGSGITPILSLVKTALREEPQSRVVLLYGNKTSDSIMFLNEIADLKDRYLDRFQVYHFLTAEEGDIDLFNGRLDADRLQRVFGTLVDPSTLDAAFICGPVVMMDTIEAGLKDAGMPADRILSERFTSGELTKEQRAAMRELEQGAAGKPIWVTLEGRRRKITFDPDKESVLENARASGLPAPFACKAGVCATCRAKVVKGEVRMIQNYGLTEAEVAQGYVLTCQAVPVSDEVELDFDA